MWNSGAFLSRGVNLEQTYVIENGLPHRTHFLSHQFFIKCGVSRVFGSKSGCGGLCVCGMVWIFVHFLRFFELIVAKNFI